MLFSVWKRSGQRGPPPGVTFAEYAPEWIDGYTGRTSRGVREATMRDYRRVLERRAIPFFGRLRLARSSRATSSATSPGRRRGRLSRHRPACARPAPRALRDRAREGLIRSNPATGVRLPATEAVEDEEQAKALTEAELGRVLLAAAPEWRLLVRLLADTGLRVGEAIALKRGDLDLGRRRLRVRQRFYKGDFAPEEPLRAPRRASLPRSRP